MSELGVGAVLSWKKFKFEDGETSDKQLVVLGAKPGHNFLLVLVTSKPHHRSSTPGCNHMKQFFFIGAGKGFPKDTWLELYRPRQARAAELLKESISGNVTVIRQLPEQLRNEIRNCLKRCIDASQDDLDLL